MIRGSKKDDIVIKELEAMPEVKGWDYFSVGILKRYYPKSGVRVKELQKALKKRGYNFTTHAIYCKANSIGLVKRFS
jgi:hypothetical protein